MKPEFKEAGIAILRYAYETCEALKVDKSDIPELLTELRDAVLIGQHPEPIMRNTDYHPPNEATPPEIIAAIRAMHSSGLSKTAIARTLGVAWNTAAKYIALAANIPVVVTPSNGATDRRADDQVPPKV